ncbi:hypothetical protein V8G54_027482 [Vigna mungo]|uniref:Ionotropic glutamate receptor C-terminal domain-containing protein n=1 Tax=Vigna mungo TaxID=3915 RepID=A0AAQ3RQH4_VIGMU
MWCATAASFLVIGIVIWILEHRVNNDFRGPPKKQIVTMLIWPIGYQVGSFAYSYLADNLYISKSRLVSLGSPEEYALALQKGPSGGGVAAIVDELPYVELFLSKETDFGIIGQPFARNSWGFAFQRESPFAFDMSTAILRLSENGDLHRLQERWFCKMGCPEERTSNSKPDQLHLISFWGLYLSCGVVSLAALVLFLLRMIRQYARFKKKQRDIASSSSEQPSGSHCSQVVVNFFNFIDEKEEAIKKMFTPSDNHHNPN